MLKYLEDNTFTVDGSKTGLSEEELDFVIEKLMEQGFEEGNAFKVCAELNGYRIAELILRGFLEDEIDAKVTEEGEVVFSDADGSAPKYDPFDALDMSQIRFREV